MHTEDTIHDDDCHDLYVVHVKLWGPRLQCHGEGQLHKVQVQLVFGSKVVDSLKHFSRYCNSQRKLILNNQLILLLGSDSIHNKCTIPGVAVEIGRAFGPCLPA
jgi:hypothetical protein